MGGVLPRMHAAQQQPNNMQDVYGKIDNTCDSSAGDVELYTRDSGKVCPYCGKPLNEFFITMESASDPALKGCGCLEPCDCEWAEEERKAIEARRISDQWLAFQNEIADNMKHAGVSKRYMGCTKPSVYLPQGDFASTKLVKDFIAAALHKKNELERPWLYIWGTYGCGKTSLACSILYHIIFTATRERHRLPFCLFTTPNMMLREIQACFDSKGNDPERVFRRFMNADVLVLDDFAKLSMSSFRADTFFDLLNTRDAEEKLTIFTSNFAPGGDLIKRLTTRDGDDDSARAIESRISGSASYIHIAGKDYRKT